MDREEVVGRLRRAAARSLAERPEVLQIWLFGSLARNEAAPGSDADLLIVVSGDPGAFLHRAGTLAPYFTGVGVGCDLLVYTQSEVDRFTAAGPSLVTTALQQGVLLARR